MYKITVPLMNSNIKRYQNVGGRYSYVVPL